MAPNPRPKRYRCLFEACDKAYNRPSLLDQHERTHLNERPFVCPEEGCDKSFFRNSHLQVHAFAHQTDSEKPFQCSICGKGATTPQLLKRHELTHTKKYKCTEEGCSEAYYRYQSLKHHVDTVHKQLLTCEECNKRFQRPLKLSEHKLKYHGDVLAFLCTHTGCFLSFKDATALQQHQKKAHPILECPKCGVSCTSAKALKTHQLVHETGKTLWKCKACGVQTVKKVDLIKHYQDIHGEVPDEVLEKEEKEQVEKLLQEADSSLQTLRRDPSFKPDFVPEEEELMEKDPKTDVEKTREDLSEKASIIDLVLGNFLKKYVCPKKNCGRHFQRLHFYEKHLKWHEAHLRRVDEFLSNLEATPAPESEDELDHFSDVDQSDDVINSDSEDSESDGPPPKKTKLESESSDELNRKQQELDALISMELGMVDLE